MNPDTSDRKTAERACQTHADAGSRIERLDISRDILERMNLSSDTRGVSEVLGAILVFALVLTVLVIVQVAGVPAANQQIEFEHNARVQGDFQEFGHSVDRMAATGAGESVTVESGVRYPPRLFLINPGPAAGTVSTGEVTPVRFGNVRALNEETADYFSEEVNFESTSLSYVPTYNQYTSAPSTIYEHGILYNTDGSDGASVFDRGNVVSGNRISLTVIEGDLSSSSTRSVAVPMKAVSAPSQKVSISADPDQTGPISLQLDTQLSESDWRTQILAGEFTNEGLGGNVESISCTNSVGPCGTLTINLDPTQTYDVRLAKIGVGSGFTEEGAAYLTKAGNTNPVINRGGSELTVEVRDRFNNGVAGQMVTFESDDGEFVDEDGSSDEPVTVQTDETGRVQVRFVPNGGTLSASILATTEFDGNPSSKSDVETVQYENLPVETEDPSDLTENDINPSGGGQVEQTGARIVGTGNDRTVEVDFENRNANEWKVTDARINYYFVGSQSGNNKLPTSTDLEHPTNGGTEQLTVAGDYEMIMPNIGFPGSAETTLVFSNWQGVGTGFNGPSDQDFFILTLLFDTDGDGIEDKRGVYFVGARTG